MRFGLADNDVCDRCGQPDSRVHTIAVCPKASAIWDKIRELDGKAGLALQEVSRLEEVLGVKEPIAGELAINAEILQVLVNTRDNKIVTLPPRIILKIILMKLVTLEKGETKVKVKTLLEKLNAED